MSHGFLRERCGVRLGVLLLVGLVAAFVAMDAGRASRTLAAPVDELNEKAAEKPAPAAKSAAEKTSDDETTTKKDTFLVWLVKSLGWRYTIIFVLVSFYGVAMIVMSNGALRRGSLCPEELIGAFEAKLDEKQYQEAYDLVKDDRSFVGRVLAAGMSKLTDGYQTSCEAMHDAAAVQNMRFERKNGYILLLAQVSPMIGLLGTVDNLVNHFDALAHSGAVPKLSELAQGLGDSIVPGLVSMWIAIPALIYFNVARNRSARLLLDVENTVDGLMRRFSGTALPPKKF